jgi:hypothetical protein
MLNIQDFAHANKNLLVIVADPQDDTIFVSFKDKQVAGKIKSADGIDYQVVKRLMRGSSFESNIERFIGALIDIIRTPLTTQQVSDFYKMVGDSIYVITQSLYKKYGKTKRIDE